MTAYALAAPAAGWKPPAWLTARDVAVAAVVAGVLLVVILLARAVGCLARAVGVAAAPAPAPKPSGGGLKRLLVLAGLAFAGLVLANSAARHGTAAAAGKPAPPAPSPSPSPRPAVTQTVTPHATAGGSRIGWLDHLTALLSHLTGTDWVLIVLIGAVVTFALVRPLLKRADS